MRWWRLSRDEALELARSHVEARGLPFTEPVSVTRGLLGGWHVLTNSGHRGGNVVLQITRDGRVRGGDHVAPR